MPNGYGTALVTVAVTDTNFGYTSTSFQLAVQSVNDRPTISAISNQVVSHGAFPWIVPFVINDIETPAASLALSATSSNLSLLPNNGLAFGGAGTNRALIISPQTNQVGSSSIAIVVSDGAASATNRFTFTVTNAPPELVVTNRIVSHEDQVGAVPLVIADRDTGPDSLRLTVSSSNSTLLPADNVSFAGAGTNGSLYVTPAPDEFGVGTLLITATDPLGRSTSTNITIVVNPVNDPPSFDWLPEITVAPGPARNTITLTGIRAGPPNESQNIGISALAFGDGVLTNISLSYFSPATTALLSFDTLGDSGGIGFINVTATDDGGALNGSWNTWEQTFAITVINPPQLQIARAGDTVRIRWPVALLDYQLERLFDSSWVPESALVTASGNFNEVVIFPVSNSALYRLRRLTSP